ncbi:MAG: hypothetical protein Q8Q59_10825 [Luteolibacter sp.]|nr:hypothetical protein [Luteolibacter sp.]
MVSADDALFWSAGVSVSAEELMEAPADGTEVTPSMVRAITSLKGVAEPLAEALAELEKLRAELRQAASEEAKRERQMRIDSENERIRQLRGNFRDIFGGAEADYPFSGRGSRSSSSRMASSAGLF